MIDPLNDEERFLQTKFWVEANSNEIHMLWERFARDNPNHNPRWPAYGFEQINAGEMVTVGHVRHAPLAGVCEKVNVRPICITVSWFYIDSVRVGFYDGCSELVDHKMIEDWFDEHYPVKYNKGRCSAYTDAGNFHNCLHSLKELRDD